MEVSIIVNHYRSPKALKLTLEYVRQWQREYEIRNGDNTTEIIVTDSATTPETKRDDGILLSLCYFFTRKTKHRIWAVNE